MTEDQVNLHEDEGEDVEGHMHKNQANLGMHKN